MHITPSKVVIPTLSENYFYGRGPKGRAGCRQTEVQTDRQTKNRQGAGATIPVLITFRCLRLMRPLGRRASIARPTASLPLCPRKYGRGLVIYA